VGPSPRRASGRALLVAVVAAAAPAASAQTRLTAEEVARRVKVESHAIGERRAQAEAAEAALAQARTALWPRLDAVAEYRRLSAISDPLLGNFVVGAGPGPVGPDNPGTSVPVRIRAPLDQSSAQLSLTVPLSDYAYRLPNAVRAAGARAEAARHDERATRSRTELDARALYYGWVRARMQREVAASALDQARTHLKDVKARAAVDLATAADVVRVESQLASSELFLRRAEDLVILLHDQLRTALEDPPGTSYSGGDDLSLELPASFEPEAAVERALRERSELRALSRGAAAERSSAREELGGGLPRLQAFGAGVTSNSNPRFFPPTSAWNTTWELGVRVVFSPSDLARGRAAASEHRARATAADEARAAVEQSIRAEVLAAAHAEQRSGEAIATTARGLAAAEESYRVRRALFLGGRATSVELTDAELELTRARIDSLDARVDLALARDRLRASVGDLGG
jgi:outer membrane protein TolC